MCHGHWHLGGVGMGQYVQYPFEVVQPWIATKLVGVVHVETVGKDRVLPTIWVGFKIFIFQKQSRLVMLDIPMYFLPVTTEQWRIGNC